MRPERGGSAPAAAIEGRLAIETHAPGAEGRRNTGGRRPAIARTARLALAILLVVLAAGCAGKSEAELANDFLQQGLDAHRAGDLVTAEKDYREALRHEPQNKYAYFNLGVIAQAQGRAAEAENDYRIALTIDQDFISPLFNLAILRTAANDTTEAIALYRHAVAVDASYAAAHFNLGLLLRRVGRTAEGDAEVAAARRLNPSLVDPGASAGAPASPSAAASGVPSASP